MASYTQKLLGDNEKILLMTRQHWLVIFRNILVELAFVVLLVVGITIAVVMLHAEWAGFLYLLLLLPAVSILIKLIVWQNQQYIVTNHRVIHINGVVNKNVIDSSLEKVNDVKLTQSYLGRMFDYGDIEIMTASELGVNLLKKIDHPIKYKTAMLNAKEAAEHIYVTDSMQTLADSRSDIPGMIAKLGELRDKGILTEAEFTQKKTELLAKIGKS